MSKKKNPHSRSLQERIGLQGGWVYLRTFWNEETGEYDRTEQSTDKVQWVPYADDSNTISITFIGGPRDGQVEW